MRTIISKIKNPEGKKITFLGCGYGKYLCHNCRDKIDCQPSLYENKELVIKNNDYYDLDGDKIFSIMRDDFVEINDKWDKLKERMINEGNSIHSETPEAC